MKRRVASPAQDSNGACKDRRGELSGPRHHVTFTKSTKTVETDETVSLLELAEAHGVRID